MTQIEIRKAAPKDRAAVETLLDASWRTHWSAHVSAKSVAFFDEQKPLAGYLDGYLQQLDILTADEEIVTVAHIEGDMLHGLHVMPRFIGQGFGARMLAHCQARGACRLEVRAFNEPAIAFYEAHGWRKQRHYLGDEMGTLLPTVEMVRDTSG